MTTGEDKPTDLHATLQEHGVKRVVIVGLAVDVCVKETALDASRLGYQTVVLSDATRPVNANPGDDQRARAEMDATSVEIR